MDVNAIQARSTQSSRLFIFSLCLSFRLICAWLTRTYDNPDEYWQGQEVAHHLVFGYGYLTWEWRERIRSFAHPLVFATIYKLLQLFKLDGTYLIVVAPRYFQASLTALADVATYSVAKKVVDNDIALPILFTTLCSWYNFFMCARTLSNTMEMILTVSALYYWPLPGVVSTTGRQWLKDYRIALALAIIACVMRPTNGLIWLFLGSQLILVSRNRAKVIVNAVIVCSIVLSASIVLDTWLYGSNSNNFVFTPYRFFQINVVDNISLFYGVHTWHWYISQGLPFILTTFLPFLGFGLYSICCSKKLYIRTKTLLYLTAWVLFVYSMLPHKEFRFIYPIIPILLILTAQGLQQVSPQQRKLCMAFLLLTQIPMALYLSLWHQRGVMDVMLWLRRQQPQTKLSVGALMPCHSTPWYSVIHRDIDMWFLTCEPPLDPAATTELDEADQFYADPVQFLETHQKDRVWPPTHLLLFDNLLTSYTEIEGYLTQQHSYRECQRFFNSHFHDDPRRRGDVVVFCRS